MRHSCVALEVCLQVCLCATPPALSQLLCKAVHGHSCSIIALTATLHTKSCAQPRGQWRGQWRMQRPEKLQAPPACWAPPLPPPQKHGPGWAVGPPAVDVPITSLFPYRPLT